MLLVNLVNQVNLVSINIVPTAGKTFFNVTKCFTNCSCFYLSRKCGLEGLDKNKKVLFLCKLAV